MTRREAVKAEIAHRQTEHVPYHLDYAPPTLRRLREHYGVEDVEQIVGSYLVWLVPQKDWTVVGEDLERDEFGVVWNTNEVTRGYVADHPLKGPTFEGHSFPDYDPPARDAGGGKGGGQDGCRTDVEGRGFILGPGITLQHDIPLENLLAFIEAAQSL